ncbi:pentapeptide repeat-containing protein [Streptomyces sp. NPDC059396]|uniref:pentapeptide repeat-containing protein n=1 Tax=Streptomyces sp. NPDC059396 TaxID=3346819 RepID=UPI00369C37E0
MPSQATRRPRLRHTTRRVLPTGAIPGPRRSRLRRAGRGPQRPRGLDWARRIELASVVLASIVAVAGLWYSNFQTQQANDQAQQDRALSKEAQITDRYTAAVNNLGDDTTDVRLGGIYALQRIMQDSPRDQPTIANVLAAYIRTHASKQPQTPQGIDAIDGGALEADVHAALTVLTTRDPAHDKGFVPDLRWAWLTGAELSRSPSDHTGGPALARANLRGTRLHGADLTNADLRGADLSIADLEGAQLSGASLGKTFLSTANFKNANLSGADLHSTFAVAADLTGSNLQRANLRMANLNQALLQFADLSRADLRRAELHDTDLRDADLRSTDLRGADLRHVNLRGADLRGADLRSALASRADLVGAKNVTEKQLRSVAS